ncbi:MAG: 4-(cytidine 5'-diphospho)-2-C-methyl-D-erythritol kinase [Candidatus Omnitrophica bacterium]|nr:4-(cytidine 5'-diphospho)-2-C-methyl-D-erythritol kinase [Candidatus Omnitrophota bacterium]
MDVLVLKAPAKLNLYLRVLNKRPDGYHNIETIFEKIGLCDTISLRRRRQGIKVFCRHKDVPGGKANLGFKAAQELLKHAGCSQGVEIEIKKKIPVAAGLGGGSSDAASVLLGVKRLLRLQIPQKKLLKIAAKIGADVPFFLFSGSRAIGRGKGELLKAVNIKRKKWYVLVVPRGLAVSTKQMYQRIRRITLTKRPYGVKIMLRALERNDLTAFNRYSYNSFEGMLQKKYNHVLEIKKALTTLGVDAALMSGSGPCVFGIAASRKEAMYVSEQLSAKKRHWRVIVARTY